MLIKYDSNNFIMGMTTDENNIDELGHTIVTVDDSYLNTVFIDRNYGIPMYKYVDSAIVKIEDFTDYLVDEVMFRKCMIKRKAEFTYLIITKTNQELKDYYDTLQSSCKLVFVECLNEYWAGAQTQFNMNLTYEGVIRILMEVLYIREIAQRPLTQDEQDTYNGLLNGFHSHVANIAGFTPASWCLTHTLNILNQCDDIRFNKLMPQRYFIAGY